LKSLAQVVFPILRSKRIGVTSLTFQGQVTSSVTIGLGIGHFLLMVLWNQASISNGFWDIQRQMYHNGCRDLDSTSE